MAPEASHHERTALGLTVRDVSGDQLTPKRARLMSPSHTRIQPALAAHQALAHVLLPDAGSPMVAIIRTPVSPSTLWCDGSVGI